MNSVIVVAYTGIKPTEAEIDAMTECLMRLKCCKKVEVVKHYDKDSIVDVISKSAITIGFEPKENEALKNAATFINAHFSSPWYLLSAVAEARGVVTRTMDQDALLNAVNIIANKSEEECEQYGIVPAIRNACYNALHYILNI